MTQPYYTAVPAQGQVVTAGPVDQNAPAAAKLYTVVSGILGLVGIASTFGLITSEQGANLGAVGTAATTLVGAVVTAVASFRTNKQLRNGTFEAAPNAPVLDAFQSINAIAAHANDTVQQAQAQVVGAVGAIQGAVAMLPGGALINSAVQAGPLGDLIQDLADRGGKL
jgi:hypothetical protein